MKALDKATTMDPKSVDGWNIKGGILAKLKKYPAAIGAYDKALKEKPDFGGAIYNRSCAYALSGNKPKALADLKSAIELNGEFKANAAKDEDLKSLWDDAEFKKLTQ